MEESLASKARETQHLAQRLAVRFASWAPVRAMLMPILGSRCCVFVLHRKQSAETLGVGHDLGYISHVVHSLHDLGCDFVSVRDILTQTVDRGLSRPRVAITIDDGYHDQGLIAETLVALGVRPTMFVLTDLASGRDWPWDAKIAWLVQESARSKLEINSRDCRLAISLVSSDERRKGIRAVRDIGKSIPAAQLPEFLQAVSDACGVEVPETPPPGYRPLDWDQINRLAQLGVDFGTHGRSHRVMSTLSDQDAENEIIGSWRELSAHVSSAIPVMAWPTGRLGDFGERDMAIAQRAGLLGAFAVVGGYCNPAGPGGRFGLQRFGMPDDEGTVLRYASGVERLARIVLP